MRPSFLVRNLKKRASLEKRSSFFLYIFKHLGMLTMKTELAQILYDFLKEKYKQTLDESSIQITPPKHKKFGDIATNFALIYAPKLSLNPHELAEIVKKYVLQNSHIFSKVEVAGPGFINCFYNEQYLYDIIGHIEKENNAYGNNKRFEGKKVLFEFVSANPTGPLHVGHGRGAVVGDVLCRLYQANGYTVTREYYYNDAGVQMKNLGKSLQCRYLELFGKKCSLEEHLYHGDYIIDIARKLRQEHGDSWLDSRTVQDFTDYAANIIIKGIQQDLSDMDIHFDSWFCESSLFSAGKVKHVFQILEDKGYLYYSEGAAFVKTSLFGDEKDRVVIKSDGTTTYFASDIAYHQDKLERGFDYLVNVLGADHHGYIPRLQASIKMLEREEVLQSILVQMVSFVKDGESMKLSTRKGEFVTLKEMIDELGSGVIRFFFSMRKPDSQMIFDWDVAREQSLNNPAYYVQYANARINSVFQKAFAEKYLMKKVSAFAVNEIPIDSEEKKELVLYLARYPQIIRTACDISSPHLLCEFAVEAARRFHALYNAQRFLSDDQDRTYGNLKLIMAVQQVLKNCADMLGLHLPDAM